MLQSINHSYYFNYDRLIFAENNYHMAMQFFVRCVCRYGRRHGFSETMAFQMIEQVNKTSNESLWVSDLVEEILFIKFLNVVCDWALENVIVE